MKVKSLSRVRLLATPWTAAYQAPPSMGFSRQEYWWGATAFSGSPIFIVYSIKYIEVDFGGFNQEDRLTTKLPVPTMIGEVESSFCILYNYYMNS